MKRLVLSIAAVALSGLSLAAGAALKPADIYGEPAQASSRLANRTITIDDKTESVNVTHWDVIRFVSGGREFVWYFDGLAQPGPLDLQKFAPAGFVDHRVTVYVSPSAIDLPG